MVIGRLIALATLVAASGVAQAAPTYIQAGRLMAVPGEPVTGPATIIVDGGRIVEVRAGFAESRPPARGWSTPGTRLSFPD